MNKKILIFIVVLISILSSKVYSQSQDSTNNVNFVKLKNGKTMFGNSNFMQDMQANTEIRYNDTLTINLMDINTIKSDAGYFKIYQKVHSTSSGHNIENILLKRIKDKRLQVYSVYNPFDNRNNNSSYDYYSKNKGSIQEINYQNLASSLTDNAESIRKLNEYNFFSKLAVKLLIVGLSTTVYGFLSDRTEGKYFKYFGITVTAGSIFSFFKKSNKLNTAIDIYNH